MNRRAFMKAVAGALAALGVHQSATSKPTVASDDLIKPPLPSSRHETHTLRSVHMATMDANGNVVLADIRDIPIGVALTSGEKGDIVGVQVYGYCRVLGEEINL